MRTFWLIAAAAFFFFAFVAGLRIAIFAFMPFCAFMAFAFIAVFISSFAFFLAGVVHSPAAGGWALLLFFFLTLVWPTMFCVSAGVHRRRARSTQAGAEILSQHCD